MQKTFKVLMLTDNNKVMTEKEAIAELQGEIKRAIENKKNELFCTVEQILLINRNLTDFMILDFEKINVKFDGMDFEGVIGLQ